MFYCALRKNMYVYFIILFYSCKEQTIKLGTWELGKSFCLINRKKKWEKWFLFRLLDEISKEYYIWNDIPLTFSASSPFPKDEHKCLMFL